MVGRIISHYRVLEKIGEGGMGVVYKARDIHLDRLVALKVLAAERVVDDERRRRFVQEAKSASSLNNPHVVTVYDIDSADGIAFIAMEYVDGRTLQALIPAQGLPPAEALTYAVQIADALAAVHAHGIIHRDLKPGNVMVGRNCCAKVLDFGLAKLTKASADEQMSTLSERQPTAEGAIVGTVGYMSPEQAEGRPLDARSDIFSFGAVLYQMLTGRPPFQRATKISTLTAILHDTPVAPARINPAVPPEIERIALCCLEKDPERRFQHAADLKLSLEWLERDAETRRPAAGVPVRELRGRRATAAATAVFLLGAAITVASVYRWRKAAARPPLDVYSVTSDLGLTCCPGLSPDGKLLAYASDRSGEGNLDLWVQQLPDGGPIRRTRSPVDEVGPHFSPDSRWIVLERAGIGVFAIPALAGEELLIAADGLGPSFSPDGTEVLYWAGEAGNLAPSGAVFVIPFGRGSPRRVAAEFADARYPVWTADGKHVLFQGARSANEKPEWWIVPVAGGNAVNTGVLSELRARELSPLPGPGESRGNRIVFSATNPLKSRHIWQVDLTGPGWKSTGPAQQLTFGTGSEGDPSMALDGRIAFASYRPLNHLWALPLTESAARTAIKKRLSQSGSPDTHPAVSKDGKTLAFLSRRPGDQQVWVRDLETGRERQLTVGSGDKSAPVLAPDGSKVAYSVVENSQSSIYVVPASDRSPGPAVRICEDCGEPSDWTRGGDRILYSAGRPRGIYLVDLAGRKSGPLLSHTVYDLHDAHVSPGGEWIAFSATTAAAHCRIFLARFSNGTATAAEQWVGATDGLSWDDKARWVTDDSIVFCSWRDHFGCFYRQPLQHGTLHPTGPPAALHHLHSYQLSTSPLYPRDFEIAVSRDSLIVNLVELYGNLWLSAPPAR